MEVQKSGIVWFGFGVPENEDSEYDDMVCEVSVFFQLKYCE